jgi:hypothetical protein
MPPATFLPLLEDRLRSRFAPFDRAELWTFVEAAWPLIEGDPYPAAWATAFPHAKQLVQVAGSRQAVERN